MKKSLPERPDFGQLKKQAKGLLHAIRAGDPEALSHLPDGIDSSALKLQDAQRILARDYGFPSWGKLKLHVESRTEASAETALIEAALQGNAGNVETLLKERPDLHRRGIYASAALGRPKNVSDFLARDPEAATQKGGPRDWSPLLYLCFGRCGGGDAERAAAADLLLKAGADPNDASVNPMWPEAPLPALYGATGVNNFPELARRLLEAGADPNDSESRYHAAEHFHVECLEVLREFGTDFSGLDVAWGNTPLYFLQGGYNLSASVRKGIRWLLENGADPNVPSQIETKNETPLHAAARNGGDIETIRLLLDHGADPSLRRADGRTAYALAVRGGQEEVARLLLDRGAPDETTAADRFLSACMRGDRTTARAELDADPRLLSMLDSEDKEMVHQAARQNRAEAIALMAELGFDLTVQDELDRGTPLHWACLQGRAEAARALIESAVPLNGRDNRYDSPPIGWVAHGSLHMRTRDGDYPACARALLAAGAEVPSKIQGNDDVMNVIFDHRLREALRRRDAKQVATLIRKGADPNHRADDGTTALHLAASLGSAETVELLLAHGARSWIADKSGKLPVDHAKEGDDSPDQIAIIELFGNPRIEDPVFQKAVEAISAGDHEKLQRLLADHPMLCRARAEESGQYAGSYFFQPYLLEFVAENPVRTGKLPPNSAELAQAIIASGAPKEAIQKTLGLVASGKVARECGVQAGLIELLVRHGADPTPGLDSAVSQGEWEAAEVLLRLGARPGLYAAAGLGRLETLKQALSRQPSPEELSRAAGAAIQGGHIDCVRDLLDAGLAADARISGHPYSPTLLHQAAWFGRAEIADLLLERGADPHVWDTQFRGTPAGWAQHAGHRELEARLREAEKSFVQK
ncbi:MAG: ankyrin repeat domain-containing protein [Puniceicoccaceae bacterium]|nr:MAG: ankyrin repeat domain-containing protein [Puniceicoccaceae bacterium]